MSDSIENNLVDMLPEQYKDDKQLANFRTVEDLVKSYKNAQSLVGKRVVEMSPEDIRIYHEKLGMPQAREKYDIETDELKDVAFKLELNQEQAKKLEAFEKHKKVIEGDRLVREAEDKIKKYEVELETSFGKETEKKLNIAKKVAKELNINEGVFDANQTGSVELIKALAEFGQKKYDHDSIYGAPLERTAKTPEVLAQERKVLMSDRKFMSDYLHQNAPGHQAAVDRMWELTEAMSR